MADLFIRWSVGNPADLGVRPISPCWPPNAIWTNVSIWMEYPSTHPDPAKRNTTATQARIGEQVWIHVAASSTGATFPFPPDREHVECQIWVCTGTNGVGPISALASAGGASGMRAVVLGAILPNTSGLASALWTPDATDNLSFDAGTAHVCLAANLVYPAAAGSTPSGQGQFLPQFMAAGQPVRTIFPCGDGPVDPRSAVPIGHFHGQRNIQVLEASPTSSMKVWGDGKRPHTLRLVERRGKGVLDNALREHLLAHPGVRIVGGRERKRRTLRVTPAMLELLDAPLREALGAIDRLPLEPRERARLAGGGHLVLAVDESIRLRPASRPLENIGIGTDDVFGPSIEIVAGADEPKTLRVDLRAAEADKPGVYRVVDLVERDDKERLVGGTTFITVGGLSRRPHIF
jgi:hypothetical protein